MHRGVQGETETSRASRGLPGLPPQRRSPVPGAEGQIQADQRDERQEDGAAVRVDDPQKPGGGEQPAGRRTDSSGGDARIVPDAARMAATISSATASRRSGRTRRRRGSPPGVPIRCRRASRGRRRPGNPAPSTARGQRWNCGSPPAQRGSRPAVERGGVAGVELGGAREERQRFRVLAAVQVQDAEVEAGLGIAGIRLQRAAEVVEGLLEGAGLR